MSNKNRGGFVWLKWNWNHCIIKLKETNSWFVNFILLCRWAFVFLSISISTLLLVLVFFRCFGLFLPFKYANRICFFPHENLNALVRLLHLSVFSFIFWNSIKNLFVYICKLQKSMRAHFDKQSYHNRLSLMKFIVAHTHISLFKLNLKWSVCGEKADGIDAGKVILNSLHVYIIYVYTLCNYVGFKRCKIIITIMKFCQVNVMRTALLDVSYRIFHVLITFF